MYGKKALAITYRTIMEQVCTIIWIVFVWLECLTLSLCVSIVWCSRFISEIRLSEHVVPRLLQSVNTEVVLMNWSISIFQQHALCFSVSIGACLILHNLSHDQYGMYKVCEIIRRFLFCTLLQAEPSVAPPGCPSGDSPKIKDFFYHCRQALLTVGIIRDAVGGKNSLTIKLCTECQGISNSIFYSSSE